MIYLNVSHCIGGYLFPIRNTCFATCMRMTKDNAFSHVVIKVLTAVCLTVMSFCFAIEKGLWFSVAILHFVEKRERIEYAETVNKIDRRFKVGFVYFHFVKLLNSDFLSLC